MAEKTLFIKFSPNFSVAYSVALRYFSEIFSASCTASTVCI